MIFWPFSTLCIAFGVACDQMTTGAKLSSQVAFAVCTGSWDVTTLSDIIITGITCTLEALARIIMSVKTKSVKLMSVNNKVRINIDRMIDFNANFSDISDLRFVDNCLKMTAQDVIGGRWHWIKTVILDT